MKRILLIWIGIIYLSSPSNADIQSLKEELSTWIKKNEELNKELFMLESTHIKIQHDEIDEKTTFIKKKIKKKNRRKRRRCVKKKPIVKNYSEKMGRFK